jgi:diguanylate cyclase (GGDEF)-like protein
MWDNAVMNGVRLFTMLNPALGLIFAVVFALAWLNQRSRTYILVLAGAALAYAAATAAQIFHLPPAVGANAMVSAFLYLGCLCLLIEAMLLRARTRSDRRVLGAMACIIFLLIGYFRYVDNDLAVRIYVLNFGAGVLFCYAAFTLARTPARQLIDRFLFWVVLVAGLHFFPRTLLSLAAGTPEDLSNTAKFGVSLFWGVLNFSLVILVVLLGFTLLLAIALDVIEDLKSERNTDPMTRLANRRGFEERAQSHLRARDGAMPCLVYCDLDNFKAINDTFGHATGDDVIRGFAELVANELCEPDIAGRIGGEEFAVLLGDTDRRGAQLFCERLRELAVGYRFPGLPAEWPVTASFGIAERRPGEDLAGLMRRADRMLYVAKRSGRDRAQMDEQPLTTA